MGRLVAVLGEIILLGMVGSVVAIVVGRMVGSLVISCFGQLIANL